MRKLRFPPMTAGTIGVSFAMMLICFNVKVLLALGILIYPVIALAGAIGYLVPYSIVRNAKSC